MFLNDDDMVECPYNKSHVMLRKRLQSHLIKCRQNYPDVELRKCPFNITHLIPEPEFVIHATSCPDRKLITHYKYDAPEPKDEEGPVHAPIECEEDWDDTDVVDYNPQAYLEKSNVLRKPVGTKPSERKLFIKKERKRLGDDSSEDEDEGKNDNDKYKNSPPSTSSYSRQRSRSPPQSSRRDRSRSPMGYRRSYRDNDDNNSYSGSQPYYSNGKHAQSYYDEETDSMPEAPPPPMISYPAPRSHFINKHSPPN